MTVISPDELRDRGLTDEAEIRSRCVDAWANAMHKRPSEAVLMVGAPGSGKSTWLAANAVPGKAYYDATLAYPATRAQLIRLARAQGVPVRVVWLRASLQTCLARNAQRSRVTPEHLIRQLHAAIEETPPRDSAGVVVVEVP